MHRLVAIAAVLLLLAQTIGHAHADPFEEEIARAFQLPAGATIIWPPRTDLSAGSVVDSSLRVLAAENRTTGVTPLAVAPITLALPSSRLSPSGAFWIWRTYLGDNDRLSVNVRLSEFEEVELTRNATQPPAFVREGDAERIERHGASATVLRAWRAKAVINISPGVGLTEVEWSALRRQTSDDTTGMARPGARSIQLAFPQPITLAVETDRSLDATARVPPVAGPKRWALATIASGRYQFLPPFMQQEWNSVSAEVVSQALADWHPTVSRALAPTDADGISRQDVLDFLAAFARDARKAKAELMVVYYIGHMERNGTGALSLLMGDAPPDKIRPPVKTNDVGNLRDLAQIIDQAEAELAPRPGTLDVAVMHRQLGRSKLRFVLLVDGCLEDPSYAAARQRLGIVVDARGGEPIYVGPGDAGDALRRQLAELHDYPVDFPYLKAHEPIILGATPGTAAVAESNPVWIFGGVVGPIARRLSDIVVRTRWDAGGTHLIRVLNYAADRQSIGPQELAGTVSWSDWLPYLRKFDPASFR